MTDEQRAALEARVEQLEAALRDLIMVIEEAALMPPTLSYFAVAKAALSAAPEGTGPDPGDLPTIEAMSGFLPPDAVPVVDQAQQMREALVKIIGFANDTLVEGPYVRERIVEIAQGAIGVGEGETEQPAAEGER